MDREQLLCYLEAALSLERAMNIFDVEHDLFSHCFENQRPLRPYVAREQALYDAFVRPRYQDILTGRYRLSCLLDDLYSYDILSEEMRDMPALTSCYESFTAGEGDHPDGPGGAYERLLEQDEPATLEEYFEMEERIVSLFNDSIRRHALPAKPIRTREALMQDIIEGASAIAGQLERGEDSIPVDITPYAPAIEGINDWVRLAKACYSRWLSTYSNRH